MYDAYNYKHTRMPLLFLDNYGDDNYDVLMSSLEYESLKNKPNIEHVRLDVYTSLMTVDKYLNCYLIDIKQDATYTIKEIFNPVELEIDEDILSKVIGGKRAYYYNIKNNTVSLRLNSDFEYYQLFESFLSSKGISKEPGREKMLSTHRITIGEE